MLTIFFVELISWALRDLGTGEGYCVDLGRAPPPPNIMGTVPGCGGFMIVF